MTAMTTPDAQALADVRAALSGLTGSLPRRAVATADGGLAERASDPDRPELTAVSVACEVLRRAAGEPVHSRHTPRLLEQCLDANDPGAWRALLDDALTGDLDGATAAGFWAADGRAALLVACLIDASSGTHAWLIVKVLRLVLEGAEAAEVRHRLATAFARRFQDLVRSLSRRVRDVSADMRAAMVRALGKLIMRTGIPRDELVRMLGATVRGPAPDDLLLLFLYAPVAELADAAPELTEALLTRAERASLASRYPACALLAVMTPEQLRPHAERVQRLVQRTLETAAAQRGVDGALALACGVLARAAAPPRSLEAALAHAMCCMSLGYLRASTD